MTKPYLLLDMVYVMCRLDLVSRSAKRELVRRYDDWKQDWSRHNATAA